MNEDTYRLAKAVLSASFQSLMNALANQDNEWEANRHFRQADHLEKKFKTDFKMHPLTYVEMYEQAQR